MDPQLLRTYLTVLECGSFSAAAGRLGYTQSAVSQQIAALETEFGTALLSRRPVAPTAAGERLVEHARAILLRLDAARADVRRTRDEPPGSLIAGASPLAVIAGGLVPAVAALRRDQPGLEVSLVVRGRRAVVESVAAGELELGLVDGAAAPTDPLGLADQAGLTSIGVSRTPLVVVLPVGHPLSRRRRLSLADLADARWIDAPDTAVSLDELRAAVETDGIRPALSYDGTDLLCLVGLVAAGHGLAVLPNTFVPWDGVVGVPVSSPRLVHRVELVCHQSLRPAAAALIELLSRGSGNPGSARRGTGPASER